MCTDDHGTIIGALREDYHTALEDAGTARSHLEIEWRMLALHSLDVVKKGEGGNPAALRKVRKSIGQICRRFEELVRKAEL